MRRIGRSAVGMTVGACVLANASLYACSSSEPVVLATRDSGVSVPDASVTAKDASTDTSGDRDPCVATAPPICAPTASWDPPAAVFPSGIRHFAAVSPDELHLAWYDLAGSDGGPLGVVRVADRASVTEPFSDGAVLGQPVDANGAGVSPNGLSLAVTVAGRPALSVRPSLAAPFPGPSTVGIDFGDETAFRSPVVAPNEGLFLTQRFVAPGQLPFTFASKVGSRYVQDELLIPNIELLSTNANDLVPRPTGMSKDLRTLFFYDEAKKVERAAFRAGPGCAYTTVVDLGDRPGAQPNADCSALYYAAPGATGSDIVRVARKP